MFAFLKSEKPSDGIEQALQVAVLWGAEDVLHEAVLSPPRSFRVGDAMSASGKPATDFVIGEETLGTDCLAIAVTGSAGTELVIPDGAQLDVAVGGAQRSLAMLEAAGELSPCAEQPGARAYRLPEGARARLAYRGFTFAVALDRATPGPALAGARVGWDRHAARCTIASLSVHLTCLLLFQLMPPHSAALSMDSEQVQSRLADYVIEQRETALEERGELWSDADSQGGDPASPSPENDPGRVPRPKEKQLRRTRTTSAEPPAKTTAELIEEAGILPLLRGASPLVPALFDSRAAIAYTPDPSLSSIFGDQTGGGLAGVGFGMIGTGRSGHGDARGTIGVGGLSTINGPGGSGGPGGPGYGIPTGSLTRRVERVPPKIGTGPVVVRGALSKEVIRRIIQRNLNQIRHCYEQGLQTRPDLEGRVAVRFMIDPSGLVKAAAREHSDLGAPAVEQCITSAVQRFIFPPPDGGGLVVVTYPFVLQQTQ